MPGKSDPSVFTDQMEEAGNLITTLWIFRKVDEDHIFLISMSHLATMLAIAFRGWYAPLIREEAGRIPMDDGNSDTPS